MILEYLWSDSEAYFYIVQRMNVHRRKQKQREKE